MKVKFALGALVSLLWLCACYKDKAEVGRDALDESYTLIDQGEYSQAIQKLEFLSLKDLRPSVKVALASAYAARGGIRVGDYWGFLIGFAAPLVPAEEIPSDSHFENFHKIIKQNKNKIATQDFKALEKLIEASLFWDRYRDRVEAIPVVKGEALQDLQLAVETLASVHTPGGRLYRAILNLILFKSYTVASGSFWQDFNKIVTQLIAGDTQVLCQFDFDELLQWLHPISYHLSETLDDLTIAFPENRGDFEPARALVQAIYQKAKEAVKELREKRSCP